LTHAGQDPAAEAVATIVNEGTAAPQIASIIVRAAAGTLMMGGMSNHFQVTEDRRIILNAENPPTLAQGYEMIRRTLTLKDTGAKLENFSSWTMGALLDEMDRFFGDDFDMTEAMGQIDRAYNTAVCALGVYRAFPARPWDLSYTHYREAWFAKFPAAEDNLEEQNRLKSFVLAESERLGLTVNQQRKVISFVRAYGTEALAEAPAEDLDALMRRLEIRAVNRNFIFQLRDQWYSYRGPFENIPNGAINILNSDTRQLMGATGTPVNLDVWTPVGAPIANPNGQLAARENAIARARETGEPVDEHAATGGNRHLVLPRTINEPFPPADIIEQDLAEFEAAIINDWAGLLPEDAEGVEA